MGSDNGGVDNQIFEVGIIRHRLEYSPPDAFGAPSTEATEHAVPVPERFWKIAPGRARAHDPQHAFHEHPVVAPGRTLLVGSAPYAPTPRRSKPIGPSHPKPPP